MTRLAPLGFFPGEYQRGTFAATGEFRKPKKGEHYLSGAIPCAYKAPNDLTCDYWIAVCVEVQKVNATTKQLAVLNRILYIALDAKPNLGTEELEIAAGFARSVGMNKIAKEYDHMAERFRKHAWVRSGPCAICGHYGDDCTGNRRLPAELRVCG